MKQTPTKSVRDLIEQLQCLPLDALVYLKVRDSEGAYTGDLGLRGYKGTRYVLIIGGEELGDG